MDEEKKVEVPGPNTPMEKAKSDVETELKWLEAEIALLRAKRNAVARALKGLGRFY